jgi:predicted nucleic acid-binding protein
VESHFRNERRAGRPATWIYGAIDCWIATLTGNQLLQRDHDFDPFEKLLGLLVLHADS